MYLISSGTSSEESYYLDNSESGGDVFFNTAAGMVPGDRDEAYDVYDARIPRPGDNPPPAAVPCQGDVCQGPPSVPSLLGAPASATFTGLGNVTQPSVQTVEAKPGPKRKKRRRGRRDQEEGEGKRGQAKDAEGEGEGWEGKQARGEEQVMAGSARRRGRVGGGLVP